jgi:hypothetical protein
VAIKVQAQISPAVNAAAAPLADLRRVERSLGCCRAPLAGAAADIGSFDRRAGA